MLCQLLRLQGLLLRLVLSACRCADAKRALQDFRDPQLCASQPAYRRCWLCWAVMLLLPLPLPLLLLLLLLLLWPRPLPLHLPYCSRLLPQQVFRVHQVQQEPCRLLRLRRLCPPLGV